MKKIYFALLLCVTAFATQAANPLLVGHRGSYWGVENTSGAFLKGIEAGYDGLETDIRITKDNEFVLWHDEKLTNGGHDNVTIANTNLDSLKQLTLTQTRGGVTYTDSICTLAEYLDICVQHNKFPVIELKWNDGINTNDQSKLPALMNLVQQKGLLDKVVILTSMKNCLTYLRSNYPTVQLQFLCYPATASDNVTWCSTNQLDVDIQKGFAASVVTAYHAEGRKVNVWTINSISEYQTYKGYGVDMITTDYLKAADVVVTEEDLELIQVWQKSLSETTYLVTGNKQRAMDVCNGKIYIVNKEDAKISVVSGADGSLVRTLNSTTGGWPINCIRFTDDKVMLLGSSNLGADSFIFNRCDTITGVCTFLGVVSSPGLGRADFFDVYGEFNSSQGGYIATASNVGMAAVFNMASGVITFDTLVAGHGAGSAAAGISSSQAIIRNDTSFFVTGQAQQRYLTYTNPALSKESFGSVKPGSAGTTGACFWFDDREFYVSGEDRYGVLQLFDITDGISSAKVVGTPTPALGSATNSAVTAPVCVEVFANHVMIYVMATNNGIAAYRLAAKEEPSSITTVKDDALMVYVREGAIVAQAAAGNTVSIYNTLGQLCAEKRVDNAHEVVIEGLAPQQIYIVKIGRKSVKVVL